MSNLKAVPLLFSPSYSLDSADVHKYFVVIFPVLTTPVNVLCYSLITTVGHRMILLPCSGREYFSVVLLCYIRAIRATSLAFFDCPAWR